MAANPTPADVPAAPSVEPVVARRLLAGLHVASIFLSAFLLFLVQPLIAKALLPEFGGSPAVWGTCLVVFQALLLAGYASADRVRRLDARTRLIAHAAIVLLPLLLLPPALRTDPPPPTAWPVPALVLALAASVAAPFFALSTNSTLVQASYARGVGREPYFLYAASNAGSLLALVAYPFFVEPWVALGAQRVAFSAGYGAFAALSIALGLLSLRSGAAAAVAEERGTTTWAQRRRWMWLAAVPSGLLVASTLHISTDVAAVPLLWVVPLALYLASFVLAFLPRRGGDEIGLFPRSFLTHAARVLVAGSLVALHPSVNLTYGPTLILVLLTLFAGAWLCHGALVAARPEPRSLGEFYLWISAGGLAGGIFGNLVAPMLFTSVLEFPIFLAALALVTVPPGALRTRAALAAATVATLAIGAPAIAAMITELPLAVRIAPLVLLAVGLLSWTRPERFAIAASAIALYAGLELGTQPTTLEARRSFFGVVRVHELAPDFVVMMHGTTTHGSEFRKTPYPIGYYWPDGPIATVVKSTPDGARIGVVGLGTGAVAGLVREGQHVDFFEIDPIVEPMARAHFTFMNGSKGTVRTVVGDARLTVAREPDASYDLLMMDAFTSDAIPIHLITRDAIALYTRKLKPGGVLLVHVSNQFLDVVPVVRGDANELGLAGLHQLFTPTAEQLAWGAYPSNVVVLARAEADLSALASRPDWEPLGREPAVVWTDERSSLLDVIRDGSWF